jgi:hypothetical protein
MEQPPEGTPERLSEYLTRYLNSLILSVNSLKDTVRIWKTSGFTGSFTGNLTGDVTGNVTGNAVKFPATQVASSDVNTLDDYEEGTWAPTLTNFTFVGANTSTYSYVKVGKLVTVVIQLIGATSVASAAFGLIPLPFAGHGGSVLVSTPYSANSYSATILSNDIRIQAALPALTAYYITASYIASS